MGNATVFLRLLHADDKAAALGQAVDADNAGQSDGETFHADVASFAKVPGSPFAYWISDGVRFLFQRLQPFEANGRVARQGAVTGNDAKFVRCWWEVRGWQSSRTRTWVPFAKSGRSSPYYCDTPLVVPWDYERGTFTGYEGLLHRPSLAPANSSLFFRPGLTWPLRAGAFCPAVMPAGCVFSIRGYAILAPESDIMAILGITASTTFDFLFKVALGRFGYPEFVVGVLQLLPFPQPSSGESSHVGNLAESCFRLRREMAMSDETDHVFHLPFALRFGGNALQNRLEAFQQWLENTKQMFGIAHRQIDEVALELYQLTAIDRKMVYEPAARGETEIAPDNIESEEDELNGTVVQATEPTVIEGAAQLLSYAVGSVIGRWDIRYATGEKQPPELPDPFDPLPVCSPGMLHGDDSLPLTATPEGYPLRIDWDGILVDDADHPDDVVRRVRDVLEVIWSDRAEAIEQEACEMLGVRELRDYFRKPGKGGFWDDHVSRYSKSRRKAPIYWLLQSSKKNYALWLYYHRLDQDLLFKALVNYVEPKIRLVESQLSLVSGQLSLVSGHLQSTKDEGQMTNDQRPMTKDRKRLAKEVEHQEDLLSELRDFEEKLRRAANLHLQPDLNDGVVLNIAPLHELVPWKEAKKYWQELLDGKYEWSSIGKQLRAKGMVK